MYPWTRKFPLIFGSHADSDRIHLGRGLCAVRVLLMTLLIAVVVVVTWAPAGFFLGMSNQGVWGAEVPSRVQGQLPGGDLGAWPPEADDIFSKWCINTSSTEFLDNICGKKTLFNISSGQVLPLAHSCGRPCVVVVSYTHSVLCRLLVEPLQCRWRWWTTFATTPTRSTLLTPSWRGTQ